MNKFNKKEAQEQIRIVYKLQSEYDSYEEWFDGELNDLIEEKKYKNSLYNIFKHALEDVFRRREEITLEELRQYMMYNNLNKKVIIVQLLALYEDLFDGDEQYQEQLVKDTIKYFNFSDKALLWARQKVPVSEVRDELERS